MEGVCEEVGRGWTAGEEVGRGARGDSLDASKHPHLNLDPDVASRINNNNNLLQQPWSRTG